MLPNEVRERLEILLSSEQIQEKTFQKVKALITDLIRKNQVDVSSEHLGPFSSHLAIAIERIEASQGLEQMNEEVKAVVQKHPDLFHFAEKLVYQCVEHPSKKNITRAEVGFITLYLLLFRENK